jgi:hypothetical protein
VLRTAHAPPDHGEQRDAVRLEPHGPPALGVELGALARAGSGTVSGRAVVADELVLAIVSKFSMERGVHCVPPLRG